MAIITFNNISKAFAAQTVFEGLDLAVHPGSKMGLIGPNGSGKTTLFRMILGEEPPDTGTINIQKGLRIGYLPQEPVVSSDRTVLEHMHEGLADLLGRKDRLDRLAAKMGTLSGAALKEAMKEYDRLSHRFELEGGWGIEARIKSILSGLGLGEGTYHTPTSALSGGQRSRLEIARILLRENDLLLLDEPTNHLDLQATCWLESFLKSSSATVLLVSHDRYLLDQLADQIVEIAGCKARVWKGNYTQYQQTRTQTILQEQRQYQKRVEEVRNTLDFIARNKDQEGMRGTARGRKTRLRRLLKEHPDYLDRPAHMQRGIAFRFAESKIQSRQAVNVEGLCKAFDDLVLLRDLSFELERGRCLGITGPNGTGKSTLLRILLGQVPADRGTVRIGPSLKVSTLDQHADTLDPNNTILDEVAKTRPDLLPEALRGKLGAFLFSGDQVFQKVSTLSGGQQNRLMLCKLVLQEPDLLLLDEPTNHLDIQSREVLEAALTDYNGTTIVVSHDRYFLDSVADELLVIGTDPLGDKQNGCHEFVGILEGTEGAYSTWAMQVERRKQEVQAKAAAAKKLSGGGARAAGPKTRTPEELRPFNRYSVEQIEAMILETEERIAKTQERFGEEAVYKDPQKLRQLQAEAEEQKEQLDLLYRAYEHRIS